jgi:hypothetical protein
MSIGNQHIEIIVDNNSSCKNLAIKDHSYYLNSEEIESPKLQIQLPGHSTWYTFDFNISQINIYNSYSFSLSPTDSLTNLPDGLYSIKYGFCPYDENTHLFYHLRQCQAWCKWEQFLKQSIDSCLDISPDAEKILNRIEFLLKGAEILANDCEPEKALELHQKAVELLTRLECTII